MHYKGQIWVRYKSVKKKLQEVQLKYRLSQHPMYSKVHGFPQCFLSQRGFNFLPSTPFHRSAQLAPSRSIIQSTIPVLYLSSNPTTYFHLLTASTLSSLFSQVKLTIKVFYSNNILFKFASKDQKRSSQDGEWQLLNWWWFSTYIFFRAPCIWSPFFILQREQHFITTAIQHKQF